MYIYLFILGGLCIVLLMILTVIIGLKAPRREPVGLLLHGIGLLILFAVCAFVMAFVLQSVSA